jgi:CheY-like chemotaxis protein
MSRRILLADDSVTIQKVIELTFMDEDYEVRAVGNGDEALAMLTALTVDFVIADVHMPGASGYEVCRRSKQLRPKVPVLLLVGTFEPFDEAQARESGADSFLKKPFDSQELLERVHNLLGAASAAAGGPPPEAAAAAAATTATQGAPATPATIAPAGEAEPAPADAAAAGGTSAAGATAADEAAAGDTSAAAGVAAAGEAAASASAAGTAEPAAAGAPSSTAGAGEGIRLTGGIEAAATWQEFELDSEPELIPDPWSDRPLPSPGAPSVPPAVRHDEQAFALGDLDEHEAPAAAESSDRPFHLGEPLDDHVLLDEAMAQEQEKGGHETPPAASPSSDAQALRATRAEPVHRFGAAALASRPAAKPPTFPEIPEIPETPEPAGALGGQDAHLGSPEQAGDTGPAGDIETAVAAGNGQPAAPPAAAALGDQDVDRIARRVVELIGDKVVRDIAWEVIPDLAEVVIKDRLRELESQIE